MSMNDVKAQLLALTEPIWSLWRHPIVPIHYWLTTPLSQILHDLFAVLSSIPYNLATLIQAISYFFYALSYPIRHLAFISWCHPLFWFGFIFIFRYLRLIVHIISFWLYKPTPMSSNPTWTSQNCTVILPTVDPENPEFIECIESCLLNEPKEIIIVTVGQDKKDLCDLTASRYKDLFPATNIKILVSAIANKRTQVALALPLVRTEISVLLDDHVLWGLNFLKTALAPFEDPDVGAVGTNKIVRKSHTGFNILSYWNMLGALYLMRHNFEIRATNAIDGGVFVISGRTSLHRSRILQDPAFLAEFTNERFFFGMFGPLNPDDDNCITRWEVKHGWKIRIQYCDDACIETTLGAYPKFVQQCLRWVRTTWRSNSASLFTDRTVWRSQPWCVYAVYITSFFNFALFNDAGLAYLLWNSPYGTSTNLTYLGLWIFATKMVKLTPYFLLNPEDLRMLPGYFAFAYFHSLIKLYAGLTFWNCHWGGRNLAAITAAAGPSDAPPPPESPTDDSTSQNESPPQTDLPVDNPGPKICASPPMVTYKASSPVTYNAPKTPPNTGVTFADSPPNPFAKSPLFGAKEPASLTPPRGPGVTLPRPGPIANRNPTTLPIKDDYINAKRLLTFAMLMAFAASALAHWYFWTRTMPCVEVDCGVDQYRREFGAEGTGKELGAVATRCVVCPVAASERAEFGRDEVYVDWARY